MSSEIIGVDVGNGYTKTANSEFVSAVKCYGETKPAITEKCVKFEGKYYSVGGARSKTKTDQKDDNTALILTLAGIGEELKIRNIRPSSVILSEGLPLERCIEENRISDASYYRKGQLIDFEYEDVPYEFMMRDVLVNPQCISGAYRLLSGDALPPICVLVDVGSWTVDLLTIKDGKPFGSDARSLLDGVITCMLRCNEEIRRRTGREVLEVQIQQIMLGETGVLPERYESIIKETVRNYCKELCDTLIENGYNVDTITCVFMGGGASVIKNFGKEFFPMARFVTDIRANARGYEEIARARFER